MIEDRRAVHRDRRFAGKLSAPPTLFSTSVERLRHLDPPIVCISHWPFSQNRLLRLLVRDASRLAQIQSSGPAFALFMDGENGMLRITACDAAVGSRNGRNTGGTKMGSVKAVKERITGREPESQTRARVVSRVLRPSDEEVRRRAFEIHVQRGGLRGYDLDDWLEAEKELTEKPHR